jgi:hypothetical protein
MIVLYTLLAPETTIVIRLALKAIDSIDYKNDTLAVFASSEGDLDITDKINIIISN